MAAPTAQPNVYKITATLLLRHGDEGNAGSSGF
jgi:hypothetical protein